MTRRRPPDCRRPFVVPAASDTAVSDSRPGRQIIEEATAGFLDIGRQMIGAATSALVDAATSHGFDGPEWEASAIRPAMVQIVASRMHDLLVNVMRPGQRAELAEADRDRMRQSAARCRSEGLQCALVDQLHAMVQTECEQYGLYLEAGHVERLRECLRDLVSGRHWSDTPAHGADSDVKRVLLSDRVRHADMVIPLLRYGDSERDHE